MESNWGKYLMLASAFHMLEQTCASIVTYIIHTYIHMCSTCTQRPNSLEWQSHMATVPDFSVMFIFVMGVNQGKCGFSRLSNALHIMHHWSFHWETCKSQRNWELWICIILFPPTPTTLDKQAKRYHSCPTQCPIHTGMLRVAQGHPCNEWDATDPIFCVPTLDVTAIELSCLSGEQMRNNDLKSRCQRHHKKTFFFLPPLIFLRWDFMYPRLALNFLSIKG